MSDKKISHKKNEIVEVVSPCDARFFDISTLPSSFSRYQGLGFGFIPESFNLNVFMSGNVGPRSMVFDCITVKDPVFGSKVCFEVGILKDGYWDKMVRPGDYALLGNIREEQKLTKGDFLFTMDAKKLEEANRTTTCFIAADPYLLKKNNQRIVLNTDVMGKSVKAGTVIFSFVSATDNNN